METEETAPEFDPFANEPAKPSRRGGGVAWLALLLAIGVAGFNGWQWWQARQAVDEGAQRCLLPARARAAMTEMIGTSSGSLV